MKTVLFSKSREIFAVPRHGISIAVRRSRFSRMKNGEPCCPRLLFRPILRIECMGTVAQFRGSIAGAIILTAFGGLWCIIALANWAARPGWSIPVAALTTFVLLALCVAQLVASRKIASMDDPVAAAKGKRAGMLFGIIFGIEGALIAISSILLASHGLGLWIPFVVALIVGLHFLPLAGVFEVPLYYGTGIFCVLGVLGCLFIHDPAKRVLCVGLVMAAVLWLSVLLLLMQPRPAPPSAAAFNS
jgi:hypothetical protein